MKNSLEVFLILMVEAAFHILAREPSTYFLPFSDRAFHQYYASHNLKEKSVA